MGGLALMTPNEPNDYTLIESLQRKLQAANERAAQAENELRVERRKTASMERGIGELRSVLTPLYRGLVHIFGEIEVMGLEAEQSNSQPRNSAVWESWKQKLSGSAAKAIDTLLLHGEMNAEQLRIHLGTATRTCYNIIGELNRAKLINKNNGKIRLKEL